MDLRSIKTFRLFTLLFLFFLSACDLGLKSSSKSSDIVTNLRQEKAIQQDQLVGVYTGKILSSAIKKTEGKEITIEIFKFSQRQNVNNEENFLTSLKAIVYYSSLSVEEPASIRVVDVVYDANTSEVSLFAPASMGLANPNYGLFVATGFFSNHQITFSKIVNFSGSLTTTAFKKVSP